MQYLAVKTLYAHKEKGMSIPLTEDLEPFVEQVKKLNELKKKRSKHFMRL